MARRHAVHAGVVTLVVGLLSAVTTATAAPQGSAQDDVPVQLRSDGGGVAVATIPLADKGIAAARRTAGEVIRTLETSGFSQVAVTWRGAAAAVEVQTRADGEWSAWLELEEIHDAPDPATEGNGLSGSDLVWVGASDAVRVRTDGATPRDLSLVLQQPLSGAGPATTAAKKANPTTKVKKAKKAKKAGVPRPDLFTRKQWGANNKWRNGKPTYTSDLKQVHIHHTATPNGYTKAEAPGLIEGMYRYHTKSLGWFDLGYNFVVDRFGRTWKGRSGGAGKLVRGAHTLGFNEGSVGIAVLGNHETKKVSKKAIAAIVRLAAWKLDKHDAPKAKGKVKVVSAGSDLYKPGTTVRLPAIDGHRDTNQTACPGAKLYKRLGEIRKRTQKRMDRLGA